MSFKAETAGETAGETACATKLHQRFARTVGQAFRLPRLCHALLEAFVGQLAKLRPIGNRQQDTILPY